MAAAEDVGEATLRAGTNFLAQGLNERSGMGTLLALPSSCGASIVRRSPASSLSSEGTIDACDPGSATILALAWSPLTGFIALAHAGVTSVQIWRVAQAAPQGVVVATVELPGVCRQLAWHPYRRLLAVTVPDRVVLVELGAAEHAAPAQHVLPLPEPVAALSGCAWSHGGATLAAACQREVVLFHWTLAGADWDRYSCVRHPIAHRQLCVLHALEGYDEDDEEGDDTDHGAELGLPADTFALGLGVPIATGDGADLSAAGSPRLLTSDGNASKQGAVELSEAAPETVDLRGRIGGDPSSGHRSILDLSAELEALQPQPPASLRQIMNDEVGGRGALLICSTNTGRVQNMGQIAAVELQRPDMLASTPIADAGGGGRVAACSSSTGHVHVFACHYDRRARSTMLQPLWAVALPDGFRSRGCVFDVHGVLLVLGGKRHHESVVFSSPMARQQLLLCAFQDREPREAAAQPARHQSPATRAPEAPPPPPPPPQQQPKAMEQPQQCEATIDAPGWLTALSELREHINSRFDGIERILEKLDGRLDCLEAQAQCLEPTRNAAVA